MRSQPLRRCNPRSRNQKRSDRPWQARSLWAEVVVLLGIVGVVQPRRASTSAPGKNRVMVLLSGCAFGHPPTGATVAAWRAICRVPVVGHSVRLIGGSQSRTGESVIDEALPTSTVVNWQQVGSGSLTIASDLPAGYPAMTTFCPVPDSTSVWTEDSTTNLTVTAGVMIVCQRFFLPEREADSGLGAITIELLACPATVELGSAGAQPCSLLVPTGVVPQIGQPGRATLSVAPSDHRGRFRAAGLPFGDYVVTLPDDTSFGALGMGTDGATDDGISVTLSDDASHLAMVIAVFPPPAGTTGE